MKNKRFWVVGFIAAVALIYAGCSSAPEKTLLDKYFHALSMSDNQTMASMAVEPLALDAESYKIVNIGQEQVAPVILPELNERELETKKAVEEHVGPVVDAKDALDIAKDDLDNARTSSARAALKRKVAELQAKYDEEYSAHMELQKQYAEAKEAAAKEEQITLFSLNLRSLPGVRDLQGDVYAKEVIINVKTKAGAEKQYKVLMRRYILKDEAGQPYNGRWIIVRFVPVS
jgi:hypothetical protein